MRMAVWVVGVFGFALGLAASVAIGVLNGIIHEATGSFDLTSIAIAGIIPVGDFLLGFAGAFVAGAVSMIRSGRNALPLMLLGAGLVAGLVTEAAYLGYLYSTIFGVYDTGAFLEFVNAYYSTIQIEGLELGGFGLIVGYGGVVAAAVGGIAGVITGDGVRRSIAGLSLLPPIMDDAAVVVAAVIRADGKMLEREEELGVQALAAIATNWVSDDTDPAQLRRRMSTMLTSAMARHQNAGPSLEALLARIPRRETVMRNQLLIWSAVIAMTDLDLDPRERALLERIRSGLGLPPESLDQALRTATQLTVPPAPAQGSLDDQIFGSAGAQPAPAA
jgi:tellurite resistance protein